MVDGFRPRSRILERGHYRPFEHSSHPRLTSTLLQFLPRLIFKIATQNPLIPIWFINLYLCEVWIPRRAMRKCKRESDGYPHDGDSVRVLIVTDPQLTDAYSYKQRGLRLALTQFYSDLYMRRNFQNLQSSLNPDEIIVLGDIMDGGRQWTNDAQFDDELRRVHHVFEISDPTNTRVHWMAGNHDIGFGNDIVPAAYTRFVDTFGPTNFAVDIPGTEVSLIGLDTVSLSSGSHDQHGQPPVQPDPDAEQGINSVAYKTARTFLDQFSGLQQPSILPLRKRWDQENLLQNTSSIPSQPKIERATSSSNPYRILLSHIPLHRPSTSDCGPHRGNPPLREGIGYQYQNLVVESLSGEILDRIKPVAVFSGDDHDWCTTEHQSQLSNGPNTYIEHTVATFSWMQGNHHPGFAVLNIHKLKNDYTSTLLPNYQQDTHFLTRLSHDTLIHTQYCDLPNQLGIYIWYIVAFILTIAISLICAEIKTRGSGVGGRSKVIDKLTGMWDTICEVRTGRRRGKYVEIPLFSVPSSRVGMSIPTTSTSPTSIAIAHHAIPKATTPPLPHDAATTPFLSLPSSATESMFIPLPASFSPRGRSSSVSSGNTSAASLISPPVVRANNNPTPSPFASSSSIHSHHLNYPSLSSPPFSPSLTRATAAGNRRKVVLVRATRTVMECFIISGGFYLFLLAWDWNL